MKTLRLLALSLSVFAVVSGVAFAQDPFGDDLYGDDPFGSSPSTDEPIAPSPKPENAQRTKEEIEASARLMETLKTMSVQKQVDLLKKELRDSEHRRSSLASRLDDVRGAFSQSQSNFQNLEDHLDSRIATLTKKLDAIDRSYMSQHSTLNFFIQAFDELIAGKVGSKTEEDAIQCLDLLSKLNSIDQGQPGNRPIGHWRTSLVSRFESAVTDMAQSESPAVRDRAVKFIQQAFPDLAIAIGQQVPKEYWLPVEAIQGKRIRKMNTRLALMQRFEFEFIEVPLEEVISYCEDLTDAVFTIAPEVDRETPIDLDAKGMLLGDVLELVLSQKKLSYNIKGSALIIVPEDKQETATLTYRVDGLVKNRGIEDIIKLSKQLIDPKHHADQVAAVNDRCVMVVADEKRQQKFAAFLAKLSAAGK